MTTLHNGKQKILLGVTGGIAAYKSAELVRRLQDHQCQIKVVMTSSAEKFIGPLTFQALTGEPVYRDLYESTSSAMEHIELARWADKILIAPASANFIAKLAGGLADDLLSTLCLAAEGPLYVAPAMNQAMWKNPATQNNINVIEKRGIQILGPNLGLQACGESGPGRLLEPAEIIEQLLMDDASLKGKTIVITAGPTKEAIDPVRFISNHSSGKMGYALAQRASRMGASVKLVSGPTALPCPQNVDFFAVESAQEMQAAVLQQVNSADIFIACAAVADYRPVEIAHSKIKKQQTNMTLELERNPDILADVCQAYPKLFCVGFAAETENLIENARHKLKLKKADLIIANQVGKNSEGQAIGFNADTNHVFIISETESIDLGTHSKTQLAQHLLHHIIETYEKRHTS